MEKDPIELGELTWSDLVTGVQDGDGHDLKFEGPVGFRSSG